MLTETTLLEPSATEEQFTQADRREVFRADLMVLADEIDRHRDMARLFASADLGDLPAIMREYLDGLPAAFGQLCSFVDHELLDHLDGLVTGEEPPPADSEA